MSLTMRRAWVSAVCIAVGAVVTVLVGTSVAAADKQPIDVLLFDGKILTGDAQFNIEQAIAVKDGLVVAVGSTAELRKEFTAETQVNLHGKTVTPGFNDAHQHIRVADRRSVGDLQTVESIADIKALVAAKAAELEPDEWVLGRGWDETIFEEVRKPNRQDLDEAAPENPVLLTRQGSHSAVANSKALEIAGIDASTPDPEQGTIERDANGEPTGVLVESAQDLVEEHVPPLTAEEQRTGTIAGLKSLLPYGITSYSSAGGTADGFRAWQSIYDEVGADLPRGSYYISGCRREDTPEDVIDSGLKPMDGDDRLRVVAAKAHADGGFTGPDAYVSQPYKGMGDFRGSLVNTPEQLTECFRKLNAAGWPIGVHTAGDAAASVAVNAFAKVLGETPRPDIRHHLMHYEVGMPKAADIRKMNRFGIGVAQQTNFLWSLEGLYNDYLQDELLQRLVPARSLLDQGIHFTNSSDVIPTSPIVGIYTSVTRKGRTGATYSPEERLEIEEALRAYTMGGAWMTHQEDVKGSLEPGKLADMIVLSDDILRIKPNCLLDVQVMETYVGGRRVYKREPGDTAGTAPPHRACR
jgi:predicted amidohydrolase YtcJ